MAKTDLDILLPEDEIVEFSALDGQRYSIKLFVPFAVGAYIIEHSDDLVDIFPTAGKRPKISQKTFDVVLKIFAMICCEQNPMMTEEWIKKNISLPRLIVIIVKIATPVYQYISGMGLLETAQP